MQLSYLNVSIKLAIGLLSLVMVINLTGKGNLAPSSAVDQIQNFVLGGIIGGMIYNESISILQYITILMIWFCLVLSLRWLKTNLHFFKKYVDGEPVTIIRRGEIDVEACRKAGLTAHDIMFKLRNNNIFSIREVKQAVLEQNGQLLVVQSGEENPRYPLITDGMVQENTLEAIGKTQDWLEERLRKMGFGEISDIFLAEYVSGEIHVVSY
ncbi:hypothetical protein GCWU000341_01082 [Oribacterium sp. oral taxon 078 str. F0262]|uniref:DUF421 domain-containing protein n=1 Tax=Oribacterium sp. oral taxon 078 TaxID=652706 RepID=UPI0001BCC23B|nr:DUF421 domain-containing protein [Oribacterium sp. oral taxon 078]EFE91898.1 hypothetical protein GCWU000341_01082 [Oribacterium sp. oral taxon 078 str. F0262]